MKHKIHHIHFIGIGGVGMSGIAEIMLNLGYMVSGSDKKRSAAIERLEKFGAKVFIGHEAEHINGADAVVFSSAINEHNPEIVKARETKIPVVPRAVMLAELMRLRKGIAVAGTHGKTTTTSLAASILEAGKLEPTFVIGGRLNAAGSNARLGSGDYIVAEADESDASFLHLHPMIAVITNIDLDHMEVYDSDIAKLRKAFIDFACHLPFYGLAIVCIDNDNVRAIVEHLSSPVLSYGFSEDADLRAVNVEYRTGMMCFDIVQKGYPQMSVELKHPGLHNVQNACAAIAVGRELEVSDDDIKTALQSFEGVNRRFTRYGKCLLPYKDSTPGCYAFELVDDYGHHPLELEKTIETARLVFPEKRLVLVFQPHRYSRTNDLFDDFVRTLNRVDMLVLSEVYSAGEAPIGGADSHSLAKALRTRNKLDPIYVAQPEEAVDALKNVLQENDVVLVMGAGSIGGLVPLLLQESHKLCVA